MTSFLQLSFLNEVPATPVSQLVKNKQKAKSQQAQIIPVESSCSTHRAPFPSAKAHCQKCFALLRAMPYNLQCPICGVHYNVI